MNLLAEEIKELIKERYYEYLEEGYPSFEAMELAKKDVYEAKDSETRTICTYPYTFNTFDATFNGTLGMFMYILFASPDGGALLR